MRVNVFKPLFIFAVLGLTIPAFAQEKIQLEIKKTQVSNNLSQSKWADYAGKVAAIFDSAVKNVRLQKLLEDFNDKTGHALYRLEPTLKSYQRTVQLDKNDDPKDKLFVTLEIVAVGMIKGRNGKKYDKDLAELPITLASNLFPYSSRPFSSFFNLNLKEPSLSSKNFSEFIDQVAYESARIEIENEDYAEGYLNSLVGSTIIIKPRTKIAIKVKVKEMGGTIHDHLIRTGESTFALRIESVKIDHKAHRFDSGKIEYVYGRLVLADGSSEIKEKHLHPWYVDSIKKELAYSSKTFEDVIAGLFDKANAPENNNGLILIPVSQIVRPK